MSLVVCASVVCSLFLTCPTSVLPVYNACVAYPPASYDLDSLAWLSPTAVYASG